MFLIKYMNNITDENNNIKFLSFRPLKKLSLIKKMFVVLFVSKFITGRIDAIPIVSKIIAKNIIKIRSLKFFFSLLFKIE